jgi:hypothetical protein
MNKRIARYVEAFRRTLWLLEKNRSKYAGHKRIPVEHVSLSEVVARLEGALVSALAKKRCLAADQTNPSGGLKEKPEQ